MDKTPNGATLRYDYGSFRGFNFGNFARMRKCFMAKDVIACRGDAVFWPSGDHAGAAAVLWSDRGITGADLMALDRSLGILGGDADEHFARLHFLLRKRGRTLRELTPEILLDPSVRVYAGNDRGELLTTVTDQLFAAYNPGLHRVWKADKLGVFKLDRHRLLHCTKWSACELGFNGRWYWVVGECLPSRPAPVRFCSMAKP